MIQQGLFTLLTEDAGIAALIGTRVYPVQLPENPTLPALVYLGAGGASKPTMETSGMQRSRMQFDGYGTTYDDAISLVKALISALNGYQGTLSDGTTISNAYLIGPPSDAFEELPRQWRCYCEFYLLYTLTS